MSKVMIYSNEHKGWWKPYYFGYTQCSKEAGIFDLEDAIKKYPKLDYDTSNEDFLVDVSVESIKEVDEALECLENLENSLSLANELLKVTDTSAMDEYIATIKQALLKAQEPKKYLKWEDLDFKEENFPIKVKVGNTEYLLCFHNIGKDQALTIQNYDQLLCTFYLNSYYDKQFFNDLHLEKVVE